MRGRRREFIFSKPLASAESNTHAKPYTDYIDVFDTGSGCPRRFRWRLFDN
jgi:hypothetical protein